MNEEAKDALECKAEAHAMNAKMSRVDKAALALTVIVLSAYIIWIVFLAK